MADLKDLNINKYYSETISELTQTTFNNYLEKKGIQSAEGFLEATEEINAYFFYVLENVPYKKVGATLEKYFMEQSKILKSIRNEFDTQIKGNKNSKMCFSESFQSIKQ